ncbi:MAG: flippase [Acidimicrobiia bacterium]
MKQSLTTTWKRLTTGILGDVAGYVGGRAVGMAVAAITGIIVARYLGPEDLGLLGFAASIYAIAVPVALLGMRQILVREFSANDDWRPILASALSRQIPVAVITSLVGFVIIVAARSGDRAAVLVAIALLPFPLLAVRDTIQALHEVAGRVRLIVLSTVGAAIAASGVKILAVAMGAPVWVFAAATTLEAVIVLLALWWGNRQTSGSAGGRMAVDSEKARALVRESWPLLIGAVAVTLYMRVDVAMLGLLSGDEETGLYVAATRISELWYFVPVAAMAAIRPRLSRRYAANEMDAYKQETQQVLTAGWVLSLIAIILTVIFAGALILFLYGDAFTGSETVLRIHILAAPFVFLGVGASQWFVDRGLTREVMVRSVAGAVANIGINLLLIPAYGATGAAIATLISYGISGVFLNAASAKTRPVFVMQMKALIGARH